MAVRNDPDRFHLLGDVVDRLPGVGSRAAYVKQWIRDRLLDHEQFIRRHGDDLPEIRGWRWGGGGAAGPQRGEDSTGGDNV